MTTDTAGNLKINNMETIAIYCRVSLEKQNIDTQRFILSKYAKERGFEYDIYEDVESTKKTRNMKQTLLNKIRSGVKYKAVVVQYLDRWARNYSEMLQDFYELNDKGIEFISIGDNIVISNNNTDQIRLLAAFYRFERDLIAERTKMGIERARAEGKTIGRPFGSKDKKKRKTIGYFLRHAKGRQTIDAEKGINFHKGLRYYVNMGGIDETNEVEALLKLDSKIRKQ